jgi:starvation-inducible DNA-binding protein
MLEQDLNVLLASTFAFALKSQRYHWHVMGLGFYSHHEFYQEIYEETYESVDLIAENIRALGQFPAGSLGEFAELSQVAEDDDVVIDAGQQMENLVRANDVVIRIIKIAMTAAKDEGSDDIEDMLVERLRAHKKHGWMLNSHIMRQQRQ